MNTIKGFLSSKRNIVISIIVLTTLIVAVTVGIVVVKLNSKEQTANLRDRMANLISQPYKIETFNANDDSLQMSITSDLSTDDLKQLSSAINEIIEDTKIKTCTISIFNSSSNVNEDSSNFYTDGLNNKIIISEENKEAEIGTFEQIPTLDETAALNNSNTDKVTKDDTGVLRISVTIPTESLNSTQKASQFENYLTIFKNNNPDVKDSKIVLEINKSDDVSYQYSSEQKGILKSIETYNF